MQVQQFQRLNLKPYAEPVAARDLKEESIYFFVNYTDNAMLLPTLEPVVFIGKNLEKNDAGLVYFQDIDSYQRGVRYGSTKDTEQATFYSGSERETSHVFGYDQALDELIRCSLRRSGARRG